MSKRALLSIGALLLVAGALAGGRAVRPTLLGGAAEPVVAEDVTPADPLAIDFEAVDLQGRPFHGNDLKGRIVLLDFWAVWCAPCLEAFPKLSQLARDLEDEPFELVGLALFSGDHENVGEFLEAHEADYTIVVGEDDLAYRYGVIGYPTYLLIDPDGNVAKKYVGALPGLEERVKTDVRELEKIHGLGP